MPSISQLVKTLSQNYPDIAFTPGERFSWSPSSKAVIYEESTQPDTGALLLHELGHALLGHAEYQRDVELVSMETSAWSKAREIAGTLGVEISDDNIQDHLDTYRDWLHARSTCPNCTANGFQTGATTYSCPACTHTWRVNEARLCALRRYSTS